MSLVTYIQAFCSSTGTSATGPPSTSQRAVESFMEVILKTANELIVVSLGKPRKEASLNIQSFKHHTKYTQWQCILIQGEIHYPDHIHHLNHLQVLQYMRTDSYAEKEEVVAVVLEDVASQLTFSCAEIKASVEAGRLGAYKKVSKDFLAQTATTTVITRHRTAWKRKCCTRMYSHSSRVVSSQ